jgi:TRAP-type C4-dicarboxylate transport system substrate-binding protein
MEINRDRLIQSLVLDSTRNITYEELLEDYREELTEHFEELTDEELTNLVKESTRNDIKRAYLAQIQLNEIILNSYTLDEVDEKIKLISDKLSVKNTKKTLDELKEIAIIDLKAANDSLKQFEGEENGNN